MSRRNVTALFCIVLLAFPLLAETAYVRTNCTGINPAKSEEAKSVFLLEITRQDGQAVTANSYLVEKNNLLFTAKHVIENWRHINAYDYRGRRIEVKYVFTQDLQPDIDQAIIVIEPQTEIEPLRFFNSDADGWQALRKEDTRTTVIARKEFLHNVHFACGIISSPAIWTSDGNRTVLERTESSLSVYYLGFSGSPVIAKVDNQTFVLGTFYGIRNDEHRSKDIADADDMAYFIPSYLSLPFLEKALKEAK